MSQSDDYKTRVLRKRERLEARLRDDRSRPTGMHQVTYERLLVQIDECEMTLDGLLVEFINYRQRFEPI